MSVLFCGLNMIPQNESRSNIRRHEDEKVLEGERRKAMFDYIKMDQHLYGNPY
jgi:hypothetical protein